MPRNEKRTITESTELGIGMLIAEAEDGTYQPVSTVMSISDARELAASYMRVRIVSLERGEDPLCPVRYQVWARRDRGNYIVVAEIEAN